MTLVSVFAILPRFLTISVIHVICIVATHGNDTKPRVIVVTSTVFMYNFLTF